MGLRFYSEKKKQFDSDYDIDSAQSASLWLRQTWVDLNFTQTIWAKIWSLGPVATVYGKSIMELYYFWCHGHDINVLDQVNELVNVQHKIHLDNKLDKLLKNLQKDNPDVQDVTLRLTRVETWVNYCRVNPRYVFPEFQQVCSLVWSPISLINPLKVPRQPQPPPPPPRIQPPQVC